MKRTILIFVSLFSISLFAQNIPDFNDLEISRIENGFKFESKPEQVKYLPPEIDTKDEWDTLFISLDSPAFNYYFVGPFYSYGQNSIVWLTSTSGYILLNNEHTYNISIIWWEPYEDVYLDFVENYNINETDELEFSRLNSIYEIEMNPVNQNGIPIVDVDFQKFYEICLLCPQGEGYFPIPFLHNEGGSSFFSTIPENIPILISSGCYDVISDNYFCYVEFPQLNGINQNHQFTNDISDFKQTNVQSYFPNDEATYSNIGMMNGVSYRNFLGEFVGYFTGFSFSWEHTKFWNGQIFIDKQNYGSYKSTVCIAGLEIIDVYSDPVLWYYSPYLEIINDSICSFYGEYPPHETFKAGNTDTLFFGESPLRIGAKWNNNNDLGINVFFDSYGFLGEQYVYPINYAVQYKLRDNMGNIVYEEEGSEFLMYSYPDEEAYEVEINYYAVPLEGGFGRAKMIASFEYGSMDASPPSLSFLQFRNSSNKLVYKISSGEDLTLHFSAADFHDHYIYVGGTEHVKYLYQPIDEDATKAYIKEYDTEEWQELMLENIHEDTIYGNYYQASLTDYLNVSNTAYDLKIEIKDYSNNACEYILNPGILVDDFTLAINEQNLISENNSLFSIHPNPTNDILYIDNPENKKIEAITLIDVNGKMIKKLYPQKDEMDVNRVSPGVYYLIIKCQEGETIEKVVIQ